MTRFSNQTRDRCIAPLVVRRARKTDGHFARWRARHVPFFGGFDSIQSAQNSMEKIIVRAPRDRICKKYREISHKTRPVLIG